MIVTINDNKKRQSTTYYNVENVEIDKHFNDAICTIYQEEKYIKVIMTNDIEINIDKE